MKLVIEVKEEDYKRYKEDKICSYASAVLDAVPLNEMLDEIKAEVPTLSHYQSNDGQDLVMVADVLECIDNHISGKEKE